MNAVEEESSGKSNMLGKLYLQQGRLAEAILAFDNASRLDSRQSASFSNKIAALRADQGLSPTVLAGLHREWSDRFEFDASSAPLLVNQPDKNRRLRIGYVSVDSEKRLAAFIEPVLSFHDRSLFDVFWYADFSKHTKTGVREVLMRNLAGANDEQAAALIYNDSIDILVDLSGHRESSRMGVFARCVAPVQLSWLGYQRDTGMNGIPFWISGADEKNLERCVRLPAMPFCWRPDHDAPGVAALPVPFKANGHITFGYSSEACRLSDFMLLLWSRLLRCMPLARMVIANIPEGFAQRRIVAQLGCEASRIDFLSDAASANGEKFWQGVDIVLDPVGFSDPGVAMQALWQGLPILTLITDSSSSRPVASVLTSIGLTDWVAQDEAHWLELAQQHAADILGLTSLRSSLRERLENGDVLNAAKFTLGLEALYRDAWSDWCRARADTQARADASPMQYHACDGAVIAAKAALDNGRIDEGVAIISAVLKTRPDWALAKMYAAGAYMGWAQTHPLAKPAWQQTLLPKLPNKFPVATKGVRVSAIICSIRPDYFAQVSTSLRAQFAAQTIEIIGIHDAKSLAEGYNRGASKAGGDILIFCHDDIDFVHGDFGTRMLNHLEKVDMVGVAGTSRLTGAAFMDSGYPNCHGQIIHARPDWRLPGSIFSYFVPGLQERVVKNIQALDGVFVAMQRGVWDLIKYDEQTFDGFHLYDLDFTYRAYLAQFKLAVPMDLLLIHFSDGTYSPVWQHYANRFLAKFPALDVPPNVLRSSPMNMRLRSLQQIEHLHTGLLHHRFGS